MADILFDEKRSILNEKFARMVAPSQSEDYLWVGKSPKKGQCVEIRLVFPSPSSSTSSLNYSALALSQHSLPSVVSASCNSSTTSGSFLHGRAQVSGVVSTSAAAAKSISSASHHSRSSTGASCRLSGVITYVGDLIAPDAFDGLICGSILQEHNERLEKEGLGREDSDYLTRDNICSRNLTAMKILGRLVEQDGTLHGQRIIAYAVLSPEYWDKSDKAKRSSKETQSIPIRKDRVYRIILKAEEYRTCRWCVQEVKDVMDKHEAATTHANDSPLPSVGRHQFPRPPPPPTPPPPTPPPSALSKKKPTTWKIPSIFCKWLHRHSWYLNEEDIDDTLSYNSDDENSFCLLIEWEERLANDARQKRG